MVVYIDFTCVMVSYLYALYVTVLGEWSLGPYWPFDHFPP